jgi:cyclopropane-fatty-acyl-phospholipid synthase
MLDRRMVYTCGYWEYARTLYEARESKLELVCRKIGLKPGDSVHDIRCGWGSFVKYAAEKYGSEVCITEYSYLKTVLSSLNLWFCYQAGR